MKKILALALISPLVTATAKADNKKEWEQLREICLELKKIDPKVNCSEFDIPAVEKLEFSKSGHVWGSLAGNVESVLDKVNQSPDACSRNSKDLAARVEEFVKIGAVQDTLAESELPAVEQQRVRKRDKIRNKLLEIRKKCGL